MFPQIVLICHLVSTVVQTDHSGMKVEVGMNSHSVLNVLRQAEWLWQEHECSRKEVIQLAVSVPVFTKCKIFWAITWLGAVGMLHHSVEEMADK